MCVCVLTFVCEEDLLKSFLTIVTEGENSHGPLSVPNKWDFLMNLPMVHVFLQKLQNFCRHFITSGIDSKNRFLIFIYTKRKPFLTIFKVG